jgi:DNA-binding response OmpR family regulator
MLSPFNLPDQAYSPNFKKVTSMSPGRRTSLVKGTIEEADSQGLCHTIDSSTETILLVEDDQMVRTLTRYILELVGYNVLEAGDGCEAMEVCNRYDGPVHLLLTDVVLPQMSGPVLCEELVKTFPDIGILYMSGYSDSVLISHGVSPEGELFLQKPFSPEALARKVRERLDDAREASLKQGH